MKTCLKTGGFTLVELLVVMFIIVLGMSLVGPGLFGTFNKVRIETESRKLSETLQKVSMMAFFHRTGYTVRLEGCRLMIVEEDGKTMSFEEIEFPLQKIFFNERGYPDTADVRYFAGREENSVPIIFDSP